MNEKIDWVLLGIAVSGFVLLWVAAALRLYLFS